MVYTNKPFPNKEFEFPEPPKWLTWMRRVQWSKAPGGQYIEVPTQVGTVRHHDSLFTARRYVGRYITHIGGFWSDWVIYEFDTDKGKYVKRWSASKGDAKKDHPLYVKDAPGSKGASYVARNVTDDEVAMALASILGETA